MPNIGKALVRQMRRHAAKAAFGLRFSTRSHGLLLVSKRECGLCRDAEALLDSELGVQAVPIVYIDDDPELEAQYFLRVPVLLRDDSVVAECPITAAEISAVRADLMNSGG